MLKTCVYVCVLILFNQSLFLRILYISRWIKNVPKSSKCREPRIN